MNRLYTVSGPSGVGKSRLVRDLLLDHPQLVISISCTTRAPRQNETDGRNYHFIDKPAFRRMIEAGEFLEHAEVFGNFYGTPRREVEQTLAGGGDMVLEIDWQGAAQIAATDIESRGVFLLPPDAMTLRRRLHERAQDHPQVIAERLAAAWREARHCDEADFIIINDDYERARRELGAVIGQSDLELRESLRRERQQDKCRRLLAELERAVANSETSAAI